MVIKWYLKMLKDYPFRVQPFTTCLLFAIGDYISQFIANSKLNKLNPNNHNNYSNNWKRTSSQCSFGFLISPLLVINHRFIVPKLFHNKMKLRLLKFLLYDCTCVTIPFQISYFSYFSFLLNGYVDKEYVLYNFKRSYSRYFLFWPYFMGLNFTFINPEYRVLTSNFAAIFWQAYMSYLSNNYKKLDFTIKND